MLGTIIGLVVGLLVYAQRPAVYRSEMQLLILRKGPDASSIQPGQGTTPGQVFYEDYIPTHQTLIKSQMILSRTLARLKGTVPHTIPPASTDGLGTLGNNLKVTREGKDASSPGNNVLNISFSGPDPEETKIVLETLKSEYDAELVETYQSLNAKYLRDLTSQQDAALATLNDLIKKEGEIARKQPLVAQNLQAAEATNTRLQQATRDYNEIKKLVTNLELDITFWANLIADAEKKKQPRSDLFKLLPREFYTPETQKNWGTNQVAAQIEGMDTWRLNKSLTIARLKIIYGEDHPEVRGIQEELDRYDSIAKANHPGYTPTPTNDKKPTEEIDPLKAFTEGLNLKKLKEVEALKWANKTLTEAQAEANEVGAFLADLRTARNALQQSQSTVDNIRSRIAAVKSVNMDVGYHLRTITEPGSGGRIGPILVIFILAGVALGFFGGVGLAYLAELSDQSFRSADEIRSRLNTPVIGHLPFIKLDTAKVSDYPQIDPKMITLHDPDSMAAEAFRGLRTALYFSLHGRGHQVIQITSPNMSDGKSTLSANLAISVAQSGKRVLLVDADLRRPRVHKEFGISKATVGLASVINGESTLEEAIMPSVVNNLFILPSGPRPSNPAEVLTSPKLPEIIEELRNQFDVVLIDTSPLLSVSDPAIVASRVDGVMLLIRLSRNSRPAAMRAKEILDGLGANLLGVVVNRSEEANTPYGYSYQYAYEYAYAYKADDGDNSSVRLGENGTGGPNKPR